MIRTSLIALATFITFGIGYLFGTEHGCYQQHRHAVSSSKDSFDKRFGKWHSETIKFDDRFGDWLRHLPRAPLAFKSRIV